MFPIIFKNKNKNYYKKKKKQKHTHPLQRLKGDVQK